MTDPELYTLVVAGLLAGVANRAPGTDVKQNYQPTQQGAQTGPTLYVHKVGDRLVGHMARRDVWVPEADEGNGAFVHEERQWIETTFQVTALATLDPNTPNMPSASDLANVGSGIIQSDSMLARMRAVNVGVLRVSEVRNPQFLDDRDRNETSPSFDFVLTHERVYIDGVPAVQSVEFNFARV